MKYAPAIQAFAKKLFALHQKLAKSEHARNWGNMTALAVLAAIIVSFAQTGTLTTPTKMPLVMNGKQVGSTTLPAGTKIEILKEDASAKKFLIKAQSDKTWVPFSSVEKDPQPTPSQPIWFPEPELSSLPTYLPGENVPEPLSTLATLAQPNEIAGPEETETIFPGENTSGWTLGACNGNQRRRITFKNQLTGCRRVVTQCPTNGKNQCSLPPPPPPTEGFKFSTKNVQSQIKNARPNTFYIDPQNYRKLGLEAGPLTVKIGTEKTYHGAHFGVPIPGKRKNCDGSTRMTASWWDGGLRGWLVTELPKKAEGSLTLAINYDVMDFQPEKTGSLPSLNPVFYTRKDQIATQDTGVLKPATSCSERRAQRNNPPQWTFPIPEGATHFVIRPGFDGKDKGSLGVWNISIEVNGEKISSNPSKTEEQSPIPEGDEFVEGNPSMEDEVIKLTNAERVAHGLHPLAKDENLTASARYHANDMALDNYFNHDSYDRIDNKLTFVSDAFTRIGRFDHKPAAENIAKGQPSPQEVLDAWMNSPGHRENILSKGATRIGVGFQNGVWVQNFGF